ncbi:MAG: hypothetical protein CVU39_03900 [Chloroflexi bacterium HGW-Chloroflexi-10]|nr:MAG: hypothetical protein CVU39_03900 [Chloroflexi bacterium HGW-Chloroflexi-10]
MNDETLILDFEQELFKKLKPVYPRQDFITQLQVNLRRKPKILMEKRNKALAILFTSMGIVFGVTILWIFRKSI